MRSVPSTLQEKAADLDEQSREARRKRLNQEQMESLQKQSQEKRDRLSDQKEEKIEFARLMREKDEADKIATQMAEEVSVKPCPTAALGHDRMFSMHCIPPSATGTCRECQLHAMCIDKLFPGICDSWLLVALNRLALRPECLVPSLCNQTRRHRNVHHKQELVQQMHRDRLKEQPDEIMTQHELLLNAPLISRAREVLMG